MISKIFSNLNLIALLTALQGISNLILIAGIKEPKHFTLEHEDLVFIILLSAYFIVAQLEEIKEKL